MARMPARGCPKCAAKNKKAGKQIAPGRMATRTETGKCEKCDEPIELVVKYCLTPDCNHEIASEMPPPHDCRRAR